MRAREEYFEGYQEPLVAGVWRRWKRHRVLFELSDGFLVDRKVELALRAETDAAIGLLSEAEDAWQASGYRSRWKLRRWSKRRMDFFKALHAENNEYEGTLRFHGIDPEDEDTVERLLAEYRKDTCDNGLART